MNKHKMAPMERMELDYCTQCHGFEGSLTTQCSGNKLSFEGQQAVYTEGLDFVDGKWQVRYCLGCDTALPAYLGRHCPICWDRLPPQRRNYFRNMVDEPFQTNVIYYTPEQKGIDMSKVLVAPKVNISAVACCEVPDNIQLSDT